MLDVPDHSLENVALFLKHYYASELVDESRFLAKTYAEAREVQASLPLAEIQTSYAFVAPFFQGQPVLANPLPEQPNPHGQTNVHLLLVYNASTLTKEDLTQVSTVSKFLFLLRFFREYVPVDCVSFLAYDVSAHRSFATDTSLRAYLLAPGSQAKKYERLDIKATIVEILRLVGFRDRRIKDVVIRETDRVYLSSIKEVTTFIAENLKQRTKTAPVADSDIDL